MTGIGDLIAQAERQLEAQYLMMTTVLVTMLKGWIPVYIKAGEPYGPLTENIENLVRWVCDSAANAKGNSEILFGQ